MGIFVPVSPGLPAWGRRDRRGAGTGGDFCGVCAKPGARGEGIPGGAAFRSGAGITRTQATKPRETQRAAASRDQLGAKNPCAAVPWPVKVGRVGDEVVGVLEGCRAGGPHSLTRVSPDHSRDCPGSSPVLPSPPSPHPSCLLGTSTSLLKQKSQQDPGERGTEPGDARVNRRRLRALSSPGSLLGTHKGLFLLRNWSCWLGMGSAARWQHPMELAWQGNSSA